MRVLLWSFSEMAGFVTIDIEGVGHRINASWDIPSISGLVGYPPQHEG
mgnify:CR=1 FL=1